MSTTGPVSPDLLREVIREVVREVIREVVAEEVAAAALGRAITGGGSGASARTPGTPTEPGTTLTRGALTERHVRAAGPKCTITIGRAVVITPLAKERAKAMGVEIIRIEE